MTDPEGNTVEDARRGDREALARLYERNGSRLLGFLLTLTGDRQVAEELFQEVWVKVIHAIGTYDPGRGTFRSWLFRIARNTTIDSHRRARVRNRLFSGPAAQEEEWDPIAEAPSAAPGPDLWTDRRRRLEAIRSAMGFLDERQRSAILLRHQQGLTHPEIALILGVPEGTAKTMIHRGIAALRRNLKEWLDEPSEV